MNRRYHGVPRFAGIVFVLTLAVYTPVSRDASAQTSAVTGAATVRLPGLHHAAAVHRDERGIPYIEAGDEEDLFAVQGYVTASDRLWQMDLLRRAARGELSEIVGRVALEEDKRRRRLGYVKAAEAQAERISEGLRRAMDAYARGVNAWIDSRNEKSLPVEFRILKYRPAPWSPVDSLLISKLLAEDLSTTWRADLMRAALSDLAPEKLSQLLPESSPLDVIVVGSDNEGASRKAPIAITSPTKLVAASIAGSSSEFMRLLEDDAQLERRSMERLGLHAEDLAASNNWVVSGKRTVTGKPLLSNDPHLAPSVPSVWYQVHLSAPRLHVAGVCLPGAPGVILGHNEHIAWGATNLGPDVQDLYLEHFDPENPHRYRIPGGWGEAELRKERIKVRKSPADPETEAVEFEVTVTRHGPIYFEKGEGKDRQRYALRWTMLDPKADPAATFMGLNHARNWREFCAALRIYPGPAQNFVYADVDGHIGYYGAGLVPIRKTGDGSLPYDGATDDGEWTGYIPFESLPHLLDPPSGTIVTANSRVVGKDYRYHLTHEWVDPYRSRRIRDLILAKPRLGVEDMRAIQGDVYSIAGAAFAAEVLKQAQVDASVRGNEAAAGWGALPELLRAWDGRVTRESKSALAVAEIRNVFRNRLLTNALGQDRARTFRWFSSGTMLDQILGSQPHEWLPAGFQDYAEFLRACWQEARTNLTTRLGADEMAWTWGNQANHFSWWKHPLADAPFVGGQFKVAFFPTDGNGGNMATVNVGPPVSMRAIADTSNWDNTRQGIALGISGDPASAHYKDQLDDWRDVAPKIFPFSRGAVAKAKKETIRFTP